AGVSAPSLVMPSVKGHLIARSADMAFTRILVLCYRRRAAIATKINVRQRDPDAERSDDLDLIVPNPAVLAVREFDMMPELVATAGSRFEHAQFHAGRKIAIELRFVGFAVAFSQRGGVRNDY